MKTQKPMRALLAAFVLLVGVSSTDAAACLDTDFKTTVVTCDCPAGTAPTGSYVSALPAGVHGGIAANVVNELAALNAVLALCVDLLPGYKMLPAPTTVLPTLCAIGDGYCPGYAFAFDEDTAGSGLSDNNVILATETSGFGSYAATTTAAYVHSPNTDFVKRTAKIACPTNTANTGQTAPFTIDKCIVDPGYYMTAVVAADDAEAEVDQCPAGNFCTDKVTHAGSPEETLGDCIADGLNPAITAGGYICPLGTYGTVGTTLELTIAALTNEVACGAGRGPDSDAENCVPLKGYYGADVVTTAAATACPTGISGDGSVATLVLGCTRLMAGYEVITDIPASPLGSAPSITALLAGITPCSANKYCAEVDNVVTFTGITAPDLTHTAVSASAGVACPDGIGNALTVSAQGVNAVSTATACVDLLPNYGFNPSATSTTDPAALIQECVLTFAVPNQYGCSGAAGIFVDYTLAANTLDKNSVGYEAGFTNLKLDVDASDFTAAAKVRTAADAKTLGATLVNLPCPDYSSNAAFTGTISSCLVDLGYYIDASNLLLPVVCTANKYCPGGGAVGTAGGLLNCPAGSVAPTAAGDENNNIGVCTVSAGFYIADASLNTPAACLAASVCAGGGAVGIAGGSVVCPTGSTNSECVAVASGGTTVNLTPASQPITVTAAPAAPSPDVTVTNTVPSASSASSTVASMVVVTVAAMIAF